MRLTMRLAVLACVMALALLIADVAAAATGSFQRTLEVSAPLELDVATGSGSITVRRGGSGQVSISGKIRVSERFGRSEADAEALVRQIEADPPVVLDGGRLTVGRLANPDARHRASISYEITVPEATTLRAQTGSGSQAVSGLAGAVDARTGSGTIELADIEGTVAASTGSGSIHAERIAGAFRGRTGSGSVRLVQTGAGDVEVSTGSGTAELSGIEGAARVRTGSGSIRLEGRQSGTWELETGSGSIRVALPDEAGFEIDARTSSGSVSSDHPVTMQGTIERGRLRGRVREGGPLVRLRTGSGDIRIE